MISYIVYLPFSVIILFHAPTSLPLMCAFAVFSMCSKLFCETFPFFPFVALSLPPSFPFLPICFSSFSFRSDLIWFQFHWFIYIYIFRCHQSVIENFRRSLISMQRSKQRKSKRENSMHFLWVYAVCSWNLKIGMKKQNQRIWEMLIRLLLMLLLLLQLLSIVLTVISLSFWHSHAFRRVCVHG